MEFIHDDDSDDIGDKRGRVNAALNLNLDSDYDNNEDDTGNKRTRVNEDKTDGDKKNYTLGFALSNLNSFLSFYFP